MKFFFLLLVVSCAQFKLDKPQRIEAPLRQVWSKNLDPYYISGNLPINLGAPLVHEDIVYMGSVDRLMRAYDAESGRLIWQKKEKSEINSKPVFFNDLVAYGDMSGRLYVRHYLTGELKYSVDLPSSIESAPVYDRGRLLVYLRGHQIVQLDALTGKILWIYKRAVAITTTLQRTTRPLIDKDKIILGFADGFVGALSREEGVLLWETKVAQTGKFIDADLNPVRLGEMILCGSPASNFKALNPINGQLVKDFDWVVTAHPVVINSQLIVGTADGDVILSQSNGEVLKKVKVSKSSVSAITYWGGSIVAASFDGELSVIDPISFKVKQKINLGYDYSAIYSDFSQNENYLSYSTSRFHLYVFKKD